MCGYFLSYYAGISFLWIYLFEIDIYVFNKLHVIILGQKRIHRQKNVLSPLEMEPEVLAVNSITLPSSSGRCLHDGKHVSFAVQERLDKGTR